MSFSSLVQIIVVNEARSGTKDGRQWSMQDAECILLKDDRTPSQVGVLMIPKDLQGKVTPGLYTASFALRPNMASRRVEAVLTGLVPVPTGKGAS